MPDRGRVETWVCNYPVRLVWDLCVSRSLVVGGGGVRMRAG